MYQDQWFGIIAVFLALYYFLGILFFKSKFLTIRNFVLSIIAGLSIGVIISPAFTQLDFIYCFKNLFEVGKETELPYLVAILSSFVLVIVSIIVKNKGGAALKIYSLILTGSLMLFLFLCFEKPFALFNMLIYFVVPIVVFCLLEKFVFDYIMLLESSLMSSLLIVVALNSFQIINSLIFSFLGFVLIFLFALALNILKITRGSD